MSGDVPAEVIRELDKPTGTRERMYATFTNEHGLQRVKITSHEQLANLLEQGTLEDFQIGAHPIVIRKA